MNRHRVIMHGNQPVVEDSKDLKAEAIWFPDVLHAHDSRKQADAYARWLNDRERPMSVQEALSKLDPLIRLLYSHEAATSLRELAKEDPMAAFDLATAALTPDALRMKHEIDRSNRKIKFEETR